MESTRGSIRSSHARLKTRRVLLFVVVMLVVVGAVIALRRGRRSPAGFDPEAAALTRYQEVRGEGVDLSRGPCLGLVGPDWVADVAHEPREAVDDDPAYQCPDFLEGKAAHFVELTPEGKVIRVQ